MIFAKGTYFYIIYINYSLHNIILESLSHQGILENAIYKLFPGESITNINTIYLF